MWLRFRKYIGIVFTIGASVLIAGEFLAVHLGWPLPYGSLFDYDEQLGYRYKKLATIDFETAGLKYQVEFDEQGIADKRQGPNGLTYILGDGLVAGLELSPDQRLGFRLSKHSGDTVINLSVTGYGAIQQERMLRRYLQQGDVPEQVVLILNMDNDLLDNVREWESSRVPSISIADRQRLVQEPQLHGHLLNIIRNTFMRSRLYGKWRASRAGIENNRQPDARTIELLSESQGDNAQIAMSILRDVLTNMAILANEYQFRFRVFVWLDPGIRLQVPMIAVEYVFDYLRSAVPKHQVLMFDCGICKDKSNYYVLGVRHFDSDATNELAVFISHSK